MIEFIFSAAWGLIKFLIPRLHKILWFLIAFGAAAAVWAGMAGPLRSVLESVFGDGIARSPRADGSPLVVALFIAIPTLIGVYLLRRRRSSVYERFSQGEATRRDVYLATALPWGAFFLGAGLAFVAGGIATGNDLKKHQDVDPGVTTTLLGLLLTALCLAVVAWWTNRGLSGGGPYPDAQPMVHDEELTGPVPAAPTGSLDKNAWATEGRIEFGSDRGAASEEPRSDGS